MNPENYGAVELLHFTTASSPVSPWRRPQLTVPVPQILLSQGLKFGVDYNSAPKIAPYI